MEPPLGLNSELLTRKARVLTTWPAGGFKCTRSDVVNFTMWETMNPQTKELLLWGGGLNIPALVTLYKCKISVVTFIFFFFCTNYYGVIYGVLIIMCFEKGYLYLVHLNNFSIQSDLYHSWRIYKYDIYRSGFIPILRPNVLSGIFKFPGKLIFKG